MLALRLRASTSPAFVALAASAMLSACGGTPGTGIGPVDGDGGADSGGGGTASGFMDGGASGDATAGTDATTPGDATTGSSDDASPTDGSSSTSTDTAAPPACIPGQSVACTGPGGCSTNQVCNADGSGFGACVCASTDGGQLACVPGQSIACVGPGGCTTNQICNSDGAGYGPCACTADAAPPPACVPGASIGCVGPGGCVSNQVCASDGSGYGACQCSKDGGSALACVPGQSIACAGPDGCSSYQVCASNGASYEPCNCPDAGSEDASAAWTPAQLPGLVLWFDDTGLVQDETHPGFVVHWLDKSGNDNIGTLSDGYNGSTNFQGSTIDPEVLNGHDAVACQGSISVAQSTTLDWGSGNFAIVVVATRSTDVSSSNLWTGNGVTMTTGTEFCAVALPSESIQATTSYTTAFEIIVARGQSLYLNVAGQVVTGGVNTTALTPGTLSISSDGMEIAEVLAVKGTLSDADLANMLQYLQARFAL